MGRLNERIFWMNRNEQGMYESGTPLTLDQVQEVFKGRGAVGAFLNGDAKQYEGMFRIDDTFTLEEVKSEEQLKSLMTWEKFEPWENSGTMSQGLEFEYPDFVHGDLRRDNYLPEMTGYTRDDLPYDMGPNPTYARYMESLGIEEGQDKYQYSDKEQAVFDIQHALDEGDELTVDDYNGILKDHGLADYVMENGTCRKMDEEFAAGLDSMPADAPAL